MVICWVIINGTKRSSAAGQTNVYVFLYSHFNNAFVTIVRPNISALCGLNAAAKFDT